MAAGAPVFTPATGKRRDKDNVRGRVLVPVLKRADEILAEQGQVPLPARVTTHKMRHTFASILAALGYDPTFIMAQLGHADAKFTLTVYAHAMRREPGSQERLRALV